MVWEVYEGRESKTGNDLETRFCNVDNHNVCHTEGVVEIVLFPHKYDK